MAIATYLLDGGADRNLCEPIVITIRIVVYTVTLYTDDYSARTYYAKGGKTALWAAAKQNDYEMVQLLLDRGADLTLANAVICSS